MSNKETVQATDLQLSPAELEMIKLKREQEENAKKAEEIKAKIELEKSIARQEADIVAFVKSHEKLKEGAQIYLKALNSAKNSKLSYVLEAKKHTQRFQVNDYREGSDGRNERFEVWGKDVDYEAYKIKVVGNDTYYIRVDKKDTRSRYGTITGSEIVMHVEGLGYKESNKALTRAQTANDKIEDAIHSKQLAEKSKVDHKNNQDLALEKLKSQFPNAEVKAVQNWRSRERSGYYEDRIHVILENKISLIFSFFPKENEIELRHCGIDGLVGSFDYQRVAELLTSLKK